MYIAHYAFATDTAVNILYEHIACFLETHIV